MRNKGTKEGTAQEINFVKTLNKKEDLSYWTTLNLTSNNYFAIRVLFKKDGLLNEAKILPKADVFIARGVVPLDYLKSKDYFLDENDIEKFCLTPLENSGVSIKREDSKNYQIMKMSPSTFKKLFTSNILASGASIYCNKEIEFTKNSALLKAWDITDREFKEYFNKALNINLASLTDATCKDSLKRIKKFSNEKIAEIINSDKAISDFIFFGIGNFKEPFTAPWLFAYGKFTPNYKMDFLITTGSGRSKGIYTIVVKPK